MSIQDLIRGVASWEVCPTRHGIDRITNIDRMLVSRDIGGELNSGYVY